MSRAITMLRLTPQAAGTLQQQHDKATKELRALTRYSKELDRQFKAPIAQSNQNALLLADLVKEAA